MPRLVAVETAPTPLSVAAISVGGVLTPTIYGWIYIVGDLPQQVAVETAPTLFLTGYGFLFC